MVSSPYDRRVHDEVVLPPLPTSVKAARQFVRGALDGVEAGDAAADALLVVSELVTNAVVHAQTDITVRVNTDERPSRIEVADGSADVPGLRLPSAGEKAGRGLLIVEHFTHEWGVDRTAGGKVVWFTVAQEG
jgi:anti-sigma regulatory factor (Ser/Thr protein kinase)